MVSTYTRATTLPQAAEDPELQEVLTVDRPIAESRPTAAARGWREV